MFTFISTLNLKVTVSALMLIFILLAFVSFKMFPSELHVGWDCISTSETNDLTV